MSFLQFLLIFLSILFLIIQYLFAFGNVFPDWDKGNNTFLPRKKIYMIILLVPLAPLFYLIFFGAKWLSTIYSKLK